MTLENLIIWLVKIGVVFGVLMTAIAYLSLIERRLLGFIQMRLGPTALAVADRDVAALTERLQELGIRVTHGEG